MVSIHDVTVANQPTVVGTGSSSSSSSAALAQPPAELPRKPLSVIEEKKSQGFYPISWRVIGGGVMMGGSREICRAFTAGRCDKGEDCPFAHEVEYDSIGHYAPVPIAQEPYTHLQVPRSMSQMHIEEPQRSVTRAPKPPSISIPPPADFLPSSSSAGTSYSAQATAIPSLDDKERKSPGSHRRTRSMTTPPVSGSPVNVSAYTR
ncbi:hypothetical protein HWV62_37444 [Athelia sp. TMB]|nr:hypothetical protein HWV62_37444 [Athelia sp. TMB]